MNNPAQPVPPTPDHSGELKQLVVGLASQVYYAVRDGQDPDSPEFAEGFVALLPALTATDPWEWSGPHPQTPGQLKAVVTECVEKANFQTSIRSYGALVHMIMVFNDLARYAEQTCPDVDITQFLRQAGLCAASNETP